MLALTLALAAALTSGTSTDLRQDDRGRPVISAQVNGKGPFDMVVDTAAQTSLLTPGLIEELGLQPLDEQLTIRGAVQAQSAHLYGVDRFSTEVFSDTDVAMLVLPNSSTTSARGIIGMERFSSGKVVFDTAARQLRVAQSSAAASGEATVAGTTDDSGLIHVPLRINGVTVQALVDSGAGPTMANMQALKALGWARDDARLKPAGTIRGATAHQTSAWIASMDTIALGPVTFRDVPLVFSDTDAGDTPYIILGSNLLNLLPGYALDFPRSELQILMPPRTAD